MNILKKFTKRGLITPPKWVPDNTVFLGNVGSHSYGTNTDKSDYDVIGICIPPREQIIPSLHERVYGFDTNKLFEEFEQHHVIDPSNNKEYDFKVHNITKFFHLLMNCNPNIIDAIFVPRECVLQSSAIFEKIRENRKKFLHKGAWPRFKGYAYSQLHKMQIKEPDSKSKRYESVMKHGYDVKFAVHVVRLLNQVEQILVEGDLDLQRNREQLKSILRGEWTMEEVIQYAKEKEAQLEKVYAECTLPWGPDITWVRELLVNCIGMHYEEVRNIPKPNQAENKLKKIQQILDE